MKKFSIVIPVHNEEEILEDQVVELIAQLKSAKRGSFEIVLMENGSTDQTKKIADKLARKYSFVRAYKTAKTSVGNAIREGVEKTKYNIVFRFDVEFWSVIFIKKALPLLNDYDMVIGSKNLPQSFDQRPRTRRVISRLRNKLLRSLFTVWFTDAHGIKGFNKNKVLKHLRAVKSPNHFLEPELTLRAHYSGLKIAEVPTAITEVRRSRFPLVKRVYEASLEFVRLLTIKNRIRSYGIPS